MPDQQTKNIIIAGYPKSGNTWATRLVAEIVQCPVRGFWQSKHKEIASEGLDRESKYACYKSHHQLHELMHYDEKPWKIIYVVRDPRDIVFSGSSYYYAGYRAKRTSKLLTWLIPYHISYRIGGREKMKRTMIGAILEGNADVHHWCRIPWSKHVNPYLKRADILKVKYRALLRDPITEARKISEFLGLERSTDDLAQAVHRQSFSTAKARYQRQGDRRRSTFLRNGRTGYWRNGLSDHEKALFNQHLTSELTALGFPTDAHTI